MALIAGVVNSGLICSPTPSGFCGCWSDDADSDDADGGAGGGGRGADGLFEADDEALWPL